VCACVYVRTQRTNKVKVSAIIIDKAFNAQEWLLDLATEILKEKKFPTSKNTP
jgi:hypothetical protein